MRGRDGECWGRARRAQRQADGGWERGGRDRERERKKEKGRERKGREMKGRERRKKERQMKNRISGRLPGAPVARKPPSPGGRSGWLSLWSHPV